jgi:hypothetical protein
MIVASGALVANIEKTQKPDSILETTLSKSVVLPKQLLLKIGESIKENKNPCYTTKEYSVRDVARRRLQDLRQQIISKVK